MNKQISDCLVLGACLFAARNNVRLRHENGLIDVGWNQYYNKFNKEWYGFEAFFESVPVANQGKLAQLVLQDTVWFWYDWQNNNEIKVYVNVNDTFDYATADAIQLNMHELSDLYDYMADYYKGFGVLIWACLKRNEKPLIEHIESLKSAGLWTEQMELLPDNNCNKTVTKGSIIIDLEQFKGVRYIKFGCN